jgi:hypothetical protein
MRGVHIQINGMDSHMGISKLSPGVEIPPDFPIPGDTQEMPVAMHSGWIFNAFCHFWVITSEVIFVYYSDTRKPISDQVPLAFAIQEYHKLIECVGRLPACVWRGSDPPASVVLFQYAMTSRKESWRLIHIQHLAPLYNPRYTSPLRQRKSTL